MEKLIEYTHESKINKNLIKYLNLISSNSSYIPLKFFTKYEVSRLEFDDDCLKYIQIKTEIKEKFKKR
jgi:hypothetical protein